jgi:DNA (cytosine-5)-methyltransferase 1
VCLRERHDTAHKDGTPGTREVAVTAAHSGKGRPKSGHLIVYRWARMLELQGLPPDFLEYAPFTVEGKRKAVGNGVPLPMGRAIARAVKAALGAQLGWEKVTVSEVSA